MTTIADPIQYTPDEIARLSKRDGKRYELFDGQLVEKRMILRSNAVATEIAVVLRSAYPRSRANIFIGQPTLNRYRKSDELKDESLLPGLVFKIADIFPAPLAATTNNP